MIKLKTKGIANNIVTVIVAKVVSKDTPNLVTCFSQLLNENIFLSKNKIKTKEFKSVSEIPFLNHIEKGDVISINPNGTIYTLFRDKSLDNSLFITDRCNSNCLMCSQPPKNNDDLDYYFNINSQLIKLIPKTTKQLGITGGEPTLLGQRFVSLLELITIGLPETQIHVLTNGRVFAWKNMPEAIGNVNNTNIIFGIPLYSDFYQRHDYIVQAKNAFNQTILGFHNMARYNLRLELRIVLHKQTFNRLASLAKFIYMNLPFVEHVAFMGLEYTGYTPKNNDLLWIEPSKYADELEEAMLYLYEMGMNVSIYNLQLCLIKPTLWKFSRMSISDWKREYLAECNKCNLLNECGGVFATSKKHSDEIKAILN